MNEYDGLTPREELELRQRREAEKQRAMNKRMDRLMRADLHKLKKRPPTLSAVEKRKQQKRDHIARARELEAEGLSRGQIAARMSIERGTAKAFRTRTQGDSDHGRHHRGTAN